MAMHYDNRLRSPGRWSFERIMLTFALSFVAWIILGY
jgi:hypothetical protein